MSWGVCRKAAGLGGRVVTLSGPDGYRREDLGAEPQELQRLGGGGHVGSLYITSRRAPRPPVPAAWPCPLWRWPRTPSAPAGPCKAKIPGILDEFQDFLTTAFNICECRFLQPLGNHGPVSALEMAQNAIRYSWSRREVDEKLRAIMSSIYDASAAAAEEYGLGYDLIAGNDIRCNKRMADNLPYGLHSPKGD